MIHYILVPTKFTRQRCFLDVLNIIGLFFLTVIRELKHQTILVPRTPTGSIFAAWQPLRMSRRSWAAVTDLKTRVLRLKPEVQILGFSKSIRYSKVEILHLKSCFLRDKETKLNANLWKAFSTELFCRRSWWFHVVLLNDLHLACKPRPRSSSARPAMPFVNQERLVLKFPTDVSTTTAVVTFRVKMSCITSVDGIKPLSQ